MPEPFELEDFTERFILDKEFSNYVTKWAVAMIILTLLLTAFLFILFSVMGYRPKRAFLRNEDPSFYQARTLHAQRYLNALEGTENPSAQRESIGNINGSTDNKYSEYET